MTESGKLLTDQSCQQLRETDKYSLHFPSQQILQTMISILRYKQLLLNTLVRMINMLRLFSSEVVARGIVMKTLKIISH